MKGGPWRGGMTPMRGMGEEEPAAGKMENRTAPGIRCGSYLFLEYEIWGNRIEQSA